MASSKSKIRFVCVSDTHNHSPGEGYTLPKGDVLIHAGDLTNQGSYSELRKAVDWLSKADFAVKIVVAGNHDLSLDASYDLRHKEGWTVTSDKVQECKELIRSVPGIVYLEHTTAEVYIPGFDKPLHVFGSPCSTESLKQNWAFQYSPDEAESIWASIPDVTDILITHTPPAGCCDRSEHWREGGCLYLSKAIHRIKPALHICGHCHEGRGAQVVRWSDGPGGGESVRTWKDASVGTKKQSLLDLSGVRGGSAIDFGKETAVINASIMAKSWDTGHKAFNKPIVIDVTHPMAMRDHT